MGAALLVGTPQPLFPAGGTARACLKATGRLCWAGQGGGATRTRLCNRGSLVPGERTQGWARRPGPAPRCLRVGPPPTLRVFCACRARAVELEAALAWDSSLTLAFTARVVRGKDQVTATITVPEEGGYAKAQALATLITPFGTKSFGRQGKVRCGGGGSGGGGGARLRACVVVVVVVEGGGAQVRRTGGGSHSLQGSRGGSINAAMQGRVNGWLAGSSGTGKASPQLGPLHCRSPPLSSGET